MGAMTSCKRVSDQPSDGRIGHSIDLQAMTPDEDYDTSVRAACRQTGYARFGLESNVPTAIYAP